MYPKTQYGGIWANGVTTFRRIIDYQTGTVGMNPDDDRAKIYVVNSKDEPFSQSW